MDDKWLGNGRHEDQWRDTNVRFTGPAVQQLQATFATGWAEATGELLTGTELFPPSARRHDGAMRATLLHTAPTIGSTAAERLLALSIAAAQHTLYITNSYFVPDKISYGCCAKPRPRRRCPRLTPGKLNDVKSTWYAGRAQYERCSRAACASLVSAAMIHAKAFVVDGCWSSISTMKFDNRSLAFNDESNLLVLDDDFGARCAKCFSMTSHDRRKSRSRSSRRPRKERILEWGASRVARIL